jgi:hypothetical protein
MWCNVLNALIGSHFKTPSERANVPQFFAKSNASTSQGYSLSYVSLYLQHDEASPHFS